MMNCIARVLTLSTKDIVVKENFPLKVMVFLIAFLFVADAAAEIFDGDRKGLIMGAAIGFGVARYASSNDLVSGHENPLAIAYNLRIGYAPSDRFQLYYTIRQTVFIPEIINNYENFFNEIGKGSSKSELYLVLSPFVIGLIPFFSAQTLMPMAFGIRQYFEPRAPSFFVDLGAGVTASSFPYKKAKYPFYRPPGNMDVTLGLFGGGGYEWRRNLNLEATISWAHANKTSVYYIENHPLPPTREKYDLFSIALSISICQY